MRLSDRCARPVVPPPDTARCNARTSQALTETPSASAAVSTADFSVSGRRSVIRAASASSPAHRLGRLLLDVEELRILAAEADLDVAVRHLTRQVERDLRERVDQPQGRGLLDGSAQAVGRLDELLAADLGQLAEIGLERFDEL